MKRIATIFLIIAASLMMAAPSAFAIAWEGLNWTIRGAANSATLTPEGYLSITVLGGNSGDPEPDNWAVYAKPTGAMWMQFTFTDPGGDCSPRAYSSGHIVGGGEMLMQGGALAPYYTPTYTNMNVWTNDWVFNDWNIPYTNRPVGDHTFKVGLGPNGEVDFFYDGSLVEAYRIGQTYGGQTFNWKSDYLNIAYLGVDTASGTSGTIIYKDFQWGTEYTPVPLPPSVLLLGSGLLGMGLLGWRRKTKLI